MRRRITECRRLFNPISQFAQRSKHRHQSFPSGFSLSFDQSDFYITSPLNCTQSLLSGQNVSSHQALPVSNLHLSRRGAAIEQHSAVRRCSDRHAYFHIIMSSHYLLSISFSSVPIMVIFRPHSCSFLSETLS